MQKRILVLILAAVMAMAMTPAVNAAESDKPAAWFHVRSADDMVDAIARGLPLIVLERDIDTGTEWFQLRSDAKIDLNGHTWTADRSGFRGDGVLNVFDGAEVNVSGGVIDSGGPGNTAIHVFKGSLSVQNLEVTGSVACNEGSTIKTIENCQIDALQSILVWGTLQRLLRSTITYSGNDLSVGITVGVDGHVEEIDGCTVSSVDGGISCAGRIDRIGNCTITAINKGAEAIYLRSGYVGTVRGCSISSTDGDAIRVGNGLAEARIDTISECTISGMVGIVVSHLAAVDTVADNTIAGHFPAYLEPYGRGLEVNGAVGTLYGNNFDCDHIFLMLHPGGTVRGVTYNTTNCGAFIHEDGETGLFYGNTIQPESGAAVTNYGVIHGFGKNTYASLENKGTILDYGGLPTFAASYYNTAAITDTGDLYVWGRNDTGQVGNGGLSTNQISSGLYAYAMPTKVLSHAATVSLSVEPGLTAAITDNGDLYLWGYNYAGQVGNGGGGDRTYTQGDGTVAYIQSTPVKVLEHVTYVLPLANAAAAITDSGDLYTWGWTYIDGGFGPQNTPVKVMSDVVQVYRGQFEHFWYAVTAGGELYVWGDLQSQSVDWKLIDPKITEASVTVDGKPVRHKIVTEPARVDFPYRVAKFDFSGSNACFITTDGVFYEIVNGSPWWVADHVADICLGGRSDMYLTDGGELYQRFDGGQWTLLLSNVVDIQGSGIRWSALTGGGSLYSAWKSDGSSEPLLENVAAIVSDHTALTFDGEFYAWGDNLYGIVGNGTVSGFNGPAVTEPCLALKGVALPGSTSIDPTKPVLPTFPDVPADDWYADAVKYVAENGLMKGDENGNFNPDRDITRGEVVTMLARRDGVDTDGGANWFDKGMEWSVGAGVSDGTNPTVTITREQFATMLYRLEGRPAVDKSVLDSYPDASDIHTWTDVPEAMAWAVETGLIGGTDKGLLDPQGPANRAQAAALMQRWCEPDN